MGRFGGASKKDDGKREARGLVALAAKLPKMAGSAMRKRGFAEPAIVADWPAIVGSALADETLPLKVVYPQRGGGAGTLRVRVTGAFATELQHLAPQVIERINGHFGYAAINRLALIQGPVSPYLRGRENQAAVPPEPAPEKGSPLPAHIADIEDEGLRDALAGLGRALERDREAAGAKARERRAGKGA